MSNSVRPHRWQPTRLPRPWDSPGKDTGVGCHFLLQCMKVKRESEVAQSCPTLSDPMDCSPSGSSVHGIFQARVLEWGAVAFPIWSNHSCTYILSLVNLPPTSHPFPPHLGYHRALVCVPSDIQQIPVGICLHMLVYMHPCYSAFISPSPPSPPPLSISLFSMSVSPLLLCEQVHQYHAYNRL